jgi:predicted ArsR family transcriptional regulator
MGYTHQGIGYQSTDTSKFAAKSNTELKISIRDQVLKLLTEADVAMSAEAVSEALGRPQVSVQPRLTELKNAGLIEDSGNRRQTKWGKPSIMWQIKTDG